ncbi:glycosyltransferase family 2 protein [Rhodobacteraceae bacterium R_SAG9]|nr:glycosyltransferase family 2 protein [Rhodobacteraceae bacterium R_SAG9]
MTNYGTINISLTSMSSRIPTLHLTLGSLLEQSYDDIVINLYLSRDPYLLDKGVPELPPEILALQKEAGGRLNIEYCPNWGPYRKLLPFLHAHWGESKLVVTVDDDTIYPKNWLQGLVDAYDTYRCVIGYRGHRINIRNGEIAPYRSWMRTKIEENPSQFILPTGKDGVLYNTAFFPVNVLNLADAMRIAPTVDDLWFRWHLLLNRIPVSVINVDYRTGTLEETDYDSSLYLNFNKGGGNDEAVDKLQAYFKKKFDFSPTDLLQPA